MDSSLEKERWREGEHKVQKGPCQKTKPVFYFKSHMSLSLHFDYKRWKPGSIFFSSMYITLPSRKLSKVIQEKVGQDLKANPQDLGFLSWASPFSLFSALSPLFGSLLLPFWYLVFAFAPEKSFLVTYF